ncbi:MAG TPA: hypothetical protein PKI59_01850, partial [Candidatus Cloacimonadota bacterium]|nr:hypothetical protein [Candidatus Cloacimonadota bacterium]
STDTRYMSVLENSVLKAMLQKPLAPQSILQTELSWQEETGKQQGNYQNSYTLASVSALASLRSVFMQKYRVSSTVSLGYNSRKGSSYLGFLPQKRQGFLADVMLNGIYRLNSFSTITMEYKASKYPEQNTIHNLKLEFKAEL